MTKRILSLALLALAACGGSNNEASFTCDVVNIEYVGITMNYCAEYEGSQSAIDTASEACRVLGGTVSVSPCRTQGALGRCDGIESGEARGHAFYFPSEATPDAAAAMTGCKNVNGNFTATGQ